MISEVAVLSIKEGKEQEFERDFTIASKYIATVEGYLGHTLSRCIEHKSQYLLFVKWEDLDSHESGFRNSKAYLEWKKLLHHYYSPFPIVEHYEVVYSNTN